MRRFLIGMAAALVLILGAYIMEGGGLSSLFLISPFLIVFGVPCCATLAVWSLGAWGRAFADALGRGGGAGSRESSARLWDFFEKVTYAAAFLAFVLGLIIIFSVGDPGGGLRLRSLAAGFVSPLYGTFFALLARVLRLRVLSRT